jgi:AbrB family looped-hinge helix DNA binding protein
MCIGMANAGKEPEFISEKSQIDDLGRIQIPREMRKKLGVNEGDILQLTATGNVIVIEKCEVEEE